MSIVLSECRVIGSGAYGKVYSGVHQGKKYATKRRYIVDTTSIPPGCIHVNEIDTMCRLKHPNLLNAITMQRENPVPDSFRSDRLNPSGSTSDYKFRADLIYMLTDTADGDLSDIFLSPTGKVEGNDPYGMDVKEVLRDHMWQVFSGIAYIHAQGFVHRDIKPSNILYFLHQEGENKCRKEIRICDFDMCYPDIQAMNSAKAMTPEYTPPEILVQGVDVTYTPKVDVWGAGHVMYHLVTGESLIVRGDRVRQDLDNYIIAVEKAHFPSGSSIQIPSYLQEDIARIDPGEKPLFDLGDPEVNDLLLHMLDCDPEKRYSVLDCMRHPFFQGREIPPECIPSLPNDKGDILVFDHTLEKHTITEDMANVFDEQLEDLSDNQMYGFFLGLDILMRVCAKKYRGDTKNLAICCFNLGMKYFDKESAKFIPISVDAAKRIEYNIISSYLGGKIYRDTVYNHIGDHADKIYRYLMAPDLLPNKLSVLINAIRKSLS